ncbi:MAG: TRAP transporter substrate-binding protein [Alphaproteobacteria bacterium]|nr:TRAP transporter substrate-binding protein [Alphaproteobacteria bacterium]
MRFRTLSALLAVAAVVAAVPASAQQKDIRWGTSAVGSSGHKALVALAGVLNKEMKNYRVTVQPTAGAVVTVKGYTVGQFDGYYGSDVAFAEFANNDKRFKGFKENAKKEPVQSFWAFTLEVGFAVHARNKDKIRSWGDLDGKKVFTGPLPWDTRAQAERTLAALGVKHNYVQVDLTTAGSLLDSGGIDAFAIYTSAESSTAPWVTEASLAADWAVVNPSQEESAKLKKAGFSLVEVKPDIFRKDVHADKLVLAPFYYGFHVGLEVPADDVYAMLKAIETRTADLAKADAAFTQIAKDMPGMQRRGVESSVATTAVHPGLAKYMREKGVWDAKWDNRIAK